MTRARVSGWSDLDMAEAEDGRSDAPMDVAMEMSTTPTYSPVETAGTTTVEPMDRHKTGKP